MKENMFYGAHPLIFKKAEELRNNLTFAEQIIWNYLNTNDWGLKFRRQHPIANYIADFYCHKEKLVIEIDGNIHEVEDVKQHDAIRQSELEDLGLKVIRFQNEEVLNNPEKVIAEIGNIVSNSSSPLGVGGLNLFVIKIGGNVIDDEANLVSFLKDFAAIAQPKILIHGGGKIATKIGDQLGIESKYINGRRITDDATIDVVTMVYGGLVNKKIVAQLQAFKTNAIGLTGADGNIIPAVKRPVKEVDFGWVGDVETDKVNVENLKAFLAVGFTPVFAPLTHDENGHILNTNADTIASSLAVALSKIYTVRLIYCFEKKGILEDINNDNSVINLINKESYQKLLTEQKLFAGIIPKIDNAFHAIDAGVKEVLVGDAKDLLQNVTDKTTGTLFVN